MWRLIIILLCLQAPAHALILENLLKNNKSILSEKKIGYYLDAFDPLTRGHEEAIDQILKLNLCDYILVYPVWNSESSKDKLSQTNIRLEMLFAVFAKHPKVIVTQMNPQKLQQSLMQNDSSHIIAKKPVVKSSLRAAKYIGIIGSDTALATVNNNHQSSAFMRGVKVSNQNASNAIGSMIAIPVENFIVVVNNGDSIREFKEQIDQRDIIKTIDIRYPEISAITIHKMLTTNQSINEFINSQVSKIITKYNLYRATEPANNAYAQELESAEKLYQAGNKEAAKLHYIQAAKLGSAEAHFAIAYYYVVSKDESIYHFAEAAKLGHEKALEYTLDNLFFRADSLTLANPQKALEIYEQAKQNNPALKLYHEEEIIKTLKMSIEPGDFDALAFIKKYNLPKDNNELYSVWSLAEEASKGGRFGEPSPKLILQLVSRGGFVPTELQSAVKETYDNWKHGIVKEFNICDHITSGAGQGFCAARAEHAIQQQQELKLAQIAKNFDKPTQELFKTAHLAANRFINAKALNEEKHEGSGRDAWIIESRMNQEAEYLALIEKIIQGFNPTVQDDYKHADQKLNTTYSKVCEQLKQNTKNNELPKPQDIRAVQRLWLTYRDYSAQLFSAINPTISQELWKTWLTEIREKQLKNILSR